MHIVAVGAKSITVNYLTATGLSPRLVKIIGWQTGRPERRKARNHAENEGQAYVDFMKLAGRGKLRNSKSI